jgi:hypothetical protein
MLCDDHHGARIGIGRNSNCHQGSGARQKVPSEPDGTRQQWKGEAAARFVL